MPCATRTSITGTRTRTRTPTRGRPAGLDFPHGVAPCELDFAYFSFTVGMTFQVSDVIVTTTPMRHTVLAQAVLAFAYNTAVLAFCLQLIFGAL